VQTWLFPAIFRAQAWWHDTNVLLRVVLRHLERSLTAAEANAVRDRIYAGLHEGTAYQWASPVTGAR
jgi:hypothetical protein